MESRNWVAGLSLLALTGCGPHPQPQNPKPEPACNSTEIIECKAAAETLRRDTREKYMKSCDNMPDDPNNLSDSPKRVCEETAIIKGIRAQREKMVQCSKMIAACLAN